MVLFGYAIDHGYCIKIILRGGNMGYNHYDLSHYRIKSVNAVWQMYQSGAIYVIHTYLKYQIAALEHLLN